MREQPLGVSLAGLRRSIGAVCWAILRDPAQVEEAIAQTTLRALERSDQRDPARPLEPWVLAIARHVAIDMLRAAGREAELTHDAEAPAREAEAPLIAAEQRAALEAAIGKLAPALRLPLTLRLVCDLDGEAIASLLGISRDAVWTRLSRARSALRSLCHDLA